MMWFHKIGAVLPLLLSLMVLPGCYNASKFGGDGDIAVRSDWNWPTYSIALPVVDLNKSGITEFKIERPPSTPLRFRLYIEPPERAVMPDSVVSVTLQDSTGRTVARAEGVLSKDWKHATGGRESLWQESFDFVKLSSSKSYILTIEVRDTSEDGPLLVKPWLFGGGIWL